MKVLIVSDTHGRHGELEDTIEKEKPFDLLIHLGDVEGGEDYICALVDCEVKMLSGNNDYYSNLPGEQEFKIRDKRLFITHGHSYFVAFNMKRLEEEARRRAVDIVMFGHIHQPVLEQKEDLTILCPGSIAFPRQIGRKPSYIVMNMDDGGECTYEIKYK